MTVNRRLVLGMGAAGLAAALAGCSKPAETGAGSVRIGLVAKALGNNFFNAVNKGAQEAAQGLQGVEVTFTGPATTSAEGQIEVLNGLIAQQVDVLAVSAVDPDALVPTLKRAAQRGIKVITYDSSVAEDARLIHLSPSSEALVGETCVQMAQSALPGGAGKIAILSGPATANNQNMWIAEMKRVLAVAPAVQLVSTVYGDDMADKSYREAVALLAQHPDLRCIIVPSSVGIVAAAKAVEDQKAMGKVFVTGLGLPSEVAGHVKAGSVKSFALWNPVDLGFATVTLAAEIARGAAAGPGATLSMGRIGNVTFDDHGVGAMGKPTVFDAANIDQFSSLF